MLERKEEMGPLDDNDIELKRQADTEWNKALDDEDRFWSIRANKLWLQQGERSTKFFHRIANAKFNRNAISRLRINGALTEDQCVIQNHVKEYYKQLYRLSKLRDSEPDSDVRRNCMCGLYSPCGTPILV